MKHLDLMLLSSTLMAHLNREVPDSSSIFHVSSEYRSYIQQITRSMSDLKTFRALYIGSPERKRGIRLNLDDTAIAELGKAFLNVEYLKLRSIKDIGKYSQFPLLTALKSFPNVRSVVLTAVRQYPQPSLEHYVFIKYMSEKFRDYESSQTSDT